MAEEGAPKLQFLASNHDVSPVQSWAWAIAILLALLACVVVILVRKRGVSTLTRGGQVSIVRRVDRIPLHGKASLAVVEFEGERILLAFNEHTIVTVARHDAPRTSDDEGGKNA